MDLTERETHLANLARELHSTRKLSPTQIRQRAGFLDGNDQPYIPLETIQKWLDGIPTAAPASSRPTSSQPTPAPPRPQWLDGTPAAAPASSRPPSPQPTPAPPRQADDTSALHAKMALMEAQLRRLSFEARRTPSPGCSPQVSPGRSERSRSASPRSSAGDSREVIAELKQMNTQLMAQLATAIAALGVVDRRDTAPPVNPAAAKPFKDWLPQVEAYTGEAHRSPEAFLAQFYLYAKQNNVPAAERTRQLIGKLTGAAQTWYTLAFSNDPAAATEAQIALGLRKAFGQEYAGARALRAMFHVTPQPTQGGHQRLLALDQREEQARQHRVPRDAGPNEHRFSRVLALFLPDELSSFLGELTADPRCSEEALRQLEETSDGLAASETAVRASLAPTSPAREELFFLRVKLAEAALRRIPAPAAGHTRARCAKTEETPDPLPATPAGAPPAAPPQATTPPSSGSPADYVARCSRLTAEHAAQSAGTGFVGPPHYFGDNKDDDRRARNQAELKRRRTAGLCFKCRVTDVKDLPFLQCPLHGALATDPNPPTVGRTRTAAPRKQA